MSQKKLFIPASIVVVGIIIAGSIFISRGIEVDAPTIVEQEETQEELSIKPVSNEDHILGNPDAEVLVVEYSDFECPYCAQFHQTMEQIMNEYGPQGKVAWVYRHFPLDEIHPSARFAAEASECVASLAGNEKFWEFTNNIFAASPESLSSENLKTIAVGLGVDEDEYTQCTLASRFKEEVENDYQDGLLIAQTDPNFGTPYSIIISKDGIQASVAGAQQYSLVKQIIDTLLGNTEI